MKYSLLDNGADSLKKVKLAIELYKEQDNPHSYHHIKDATIYLNQSIEVLLKYILSSRNESLIFKDLNDYIKAKDELFKRYQGQVRVEEGFGYYPNSEYTVFDTKKGEKLKTIGLHAAIERIQYLCDIEMSDEFVGAIHKVNKFRNKLMHHSLMVHSRVELDKYVKDIEFLYESAVTFFENNIPGILEKIDLQRFEIDRKEWEELQREMQAYYEERAMSKIISDDIF